jgi:uncharacterized membrane protein HdeD (DUF308 family)
VAIFFMLGAIAAFSFTAGVFFLRFWRDTRDFFFFSFAFFFLVEAGIRIALLFLPHPNEGSTWMYGLRLLTLSIILYAILHKNYGRG